MVQTLFVIPALLAKTSIPFKPWFATILFNWSAEEMLVKGVLWGWYVEAIYDDVLYGRRAVEIFVSVAAGVIYVLAASV